MKLRKIEQQFVILFHRDGWCIRGWLPRLTRTHSKYSRYYGLQIGPILVNIEFLLW